MIQKLVAIDGMSCGHCVNRINGALANLPGIEGADVKVGSALVTYDPGITDESKIREAIEDAGYQVRGSETLPVTSARSCCSAK